jgi:hypothetical protein
MAKFSRQDYVQIAHTIDTVWSKLFAGAHTEHERFCVKVDMEAVVTAFADMFQADNPRFDRERFVMACEGEVVQ